MQEMLLQLGHSPDPDDAFMFYALAQNPPLIDTGRYRFNHVMQDIQTLSQRARNGDLEITAISVHAYPYVADKYALTSCGSSMGDKYGPMVVTREPMAIDDLRGKTIAIPGVLTTAFLTLQLMIGKGAQYDAAKRASGEQKPGDAAFFYEVIEFDQIPAAVQQGVCDAGLLIHEGQITYKKAGLHLVVDVGVWWHEQTGLPLPLGGNCIRRDLGGQTMQEVTDILKASIQFSLDNREKAVEYSLKYGRDLDHKLADEFVGMYVNHWTLDYGDRGRAAITRLLGDGAKAGLVPEIGEIDYVVAR